MSRIPPPPPAPSPIPMPPAPSRGLRMSYFHALGLLWAFKLLLAFLLALLAELAKDQELPQELGAWAWTLFVAALIRTGPETLAYVQTIIRYLERRTTALAPPELGGERIGDER